MPSKRRRVDEVIVDAVASPGRFGRVVTRPTELDLRSWSSSWRDSVVLPAPEGDDSTSISRGARRWIGAS